MPVYKDRERNTWYVKGRYRDWQGNSRWLTKRGFAMKRDAVAWEAEFRMRQAADLDMPSAEFDMMEHDAFINRARNAYAVVQTGETALYGNIIIRKGVVRL